MAWSSAGSLNLPQSVYPNLVGVGGFLPFQILGERESVWKMVLPFTTEICRDHLSLGMSSCQL